MLKEFETQLKLFEMQVERYNYSHLEAIDYLKRKRNSYVQYITSLKFYKICKTIFRYKIELKIISSL